MKRLSMLMVLPVFILFLSPALSALTTEEVLLLKEKGVSEKTIQLMIQNEKEKETPGTESGISERQLSDKTSEIIYSTGPPSVTKIDTEEQKKMDNAWEMLKNMHIEIEK